MPQSDSSNSIFKSDSYVVDSQGALFDERNDIQASFTKRIPFDSLNRLEFEEFRRVNQRLRENPLVPISTFYCIEYRQNEVRLIRNLIPGDSITKVIQQNDISATINAFSKLAKALAEAHLLGAIHQNIKPSNVILDGVGNVTLVDGFLNPLNRSAHSDSATNYCSMMFSSPEQLGLIKQEIGPFSDLYALGMLLYECLTGKPPFAGADASKVIFDHVSASVRSLHEIQPGIPPSLNEVVLRLLRKQPDERYQTAESLFHDLELIKRELESGQPAIGIAIGTTDIRSQLTEPSFVGRQMELSTLLSLHQKTQSGQADLLVIESESGCGKTRLLDEFRKITRQQNCLILSGTGSNDVGSSPFTILDGIVEGVVAELKSNPEFELVIAKEQQLTLARAFPLLSQQAPNLFDIDFGDESDLGPEAFGAQRNVNAISHLINQLPNANRPIILILDDCQFASQPVVQFLRQFRKTVESTPVGQRWLSVVVSFSSEETPAKHPLRNLRTSSHLNLERFDLKQTCALACSMAGQIPTRAIELIQSTAVGSPFMIHAVVRGMVESSALQPDKLGWSINQNRLADLRSSKVAGDFLAKRIDLLPQRLIQFLTLASILGKSFETKIVCSLIQSAREPAESNQPAATPTSEAEIPGDSPHGEDDWKAMLFEAQSKQLIWLNPDGTQATFIHEKIRTSLLERLDDDSIRVLHLKAGKYFLKNSPKQFVEMAVHFDSAGMHSLALPHAIEAAKIARLRNSLDIAGRMYEIAWRSSKPELAFGVNSDESRLNIIEGLGEVQMLQGKYDQAEESFKEASKLAWSKLEKARVHGKLGELAFKRGEMNSSLQMLTQALKTLGRPAPGPISLMVRFARELIVQFLHSMFPRLFLERFKRQPDESERLELHLLSRYSHACWFACSKSACLWAHFRNLNLAERFTPTSELGQAYSDHGPAMSLIPYPARGIKYTTRSLEVRSQLGDRWGQGQSLHYLGVVLYSASRFEDCIRSCRKAVRYLEQTGDYWEVHIARFQIAASLYCLGKFSEAETEARLIYESGIEHGDQQASAMSLDILGRVNPGQIDQATFDIERARERVDTQGTSQMLIGQGVKYICSGELNKAEETFRLALATSRKSNNHNVYVLPNYAWLVTALRLQAEQVPNYHPHRRVQLLRKAKRAAFIGRLLSWPFKHNRAHICRENAMLAAMSGQKTHARQWMKKSIATAEKIGATYEKSLSEYLLAQLELNEQSTATEVADVTFDQDDSLARKPKFADQLFQIKDAGPVNSESAQETVSLADRFNLLLSSGRQITTALDEDTILSAVRSAALRLIRGQRCSTIKLTFDGTNYEPEIDPSKPLGHLDIDLIQLALEKNKTVSSSRFADVGHENQFETGSLLASPIRVRGNLSACLLIAHDEISGLFQETEERLGDFVATLAGAALENADGFKRLEQLNSSLESRVEERTAQLNNRALELASSNEKLKKVALDLTNAQTELEDAKHRVELASLAKSDFLATMSHEIRTPMNAVIGMTQMCLDTQLNQVQRGYLKTVKQSAKSLMRILNDILDFSKIEAGKMDIEQISLDIRAVVEDSCQLMAVTAYPKGLELVMELDPEIPTNLLGDPGRMQQILINLIGNAIKFTEKGHVSVSAKVMHQEQDAVTIQFCVSDTGIGISKDKQAKVFGSFSQADSSTTRKFGGTGLGLSICSRLVELMNGKIWVESEEYQGSQFIFQVEFSTDQDLIETVDSVRDTLAGKSVAIVGSEPYLQSSLERTTQWLGASETSLFESVNRISAEKVDLVLLEIPNGDGDGSISWEQPISDLMSLNCPAIVVFPKSMTSLTELVGPDSNIRFMAKPVTPSGLHHSIRSLFGLSNGESAASKSEIATQAGSPKPVRVLQVLLAEDVEINRLIAVNVIERMGHNVRIAENGLRALEEMENHLFDLVLMDVEMPEMDGVEAAKRIRMMEQGSQIPIVAMTAHVVPEIRKKCADAGMNDYITKPLEFEKLQALLNQVASELE